MKKINPSIFIKAPREKVWEVMLSGETYRNWTSAFHPGSYYKGNIEVEGEKILFIGPDDNGGEAGMVSRIKESRKPEFLSIEHLGIYKDGIEDTESAEAKKWAPAFENYSFIDRDGGTELVIDQDIEEEYKASFEKMWEEGLKKLKELAEK